MSEAVKLKGGGETWPITGPYCAHTFMPKWILSKDLKARKTIRCPNRGKTLFLGEDYTIDEYPGERG